MPSAPCLSLTCTPLLQAEMQQRSWAFGHQPASQAAVTWACIYHQLDGFGPEARAWSSAHYKVGKDVQGALFSASTRFFDGDTSRDQDDVHVCRADRAY